MQDLTAIINAFSKIQLESPLKRTLESLVKISLSRISIKIYQLQNWRIFLTNSEVSFPQRWPWMNKMTQEDMLISNLKPENLRKTV